MWRWRTNRQVHRCAAPCSTVLQYSTLLHCAALALQYCVALCCTAHMSAAMLFATYVEWSDAQFFTAVVLFSWRWNIDGFLRFSLLYKCIIPHLWHKQAIKQAQQLNNHMSYRSQVSRRAIANFSYCISMHHWIVLTCFTLQGQVQQCWCSGNACGKGRAHWSVNLCSAGVCWRAISKYLKLLKFELRPI